MDDYPNFYIGVFFAMLGSIASGFAYLMMRRMGKDIDASLNPLWFGVFTTYGSVLICTIFDH